MMVSYKLFPEISKKLIRKSWRNRGTFRRHIPIIFSCLVISNYIPWISHGYHPHWQKIPVFHFRKVSFPLKKSSSGSFFIGRRIHVAQKSWICPGKKSWFPWKMARNRVDQPDQRKPTTPGGSGALSLLRPCCDATRNLLGSSLEATLWCHRVLCCDAVIF